MSVWSLDLGSCNSAVACWSESHGHPLMIHLPDVCRAEFQDDGIETKYAVPSAVLALEPQNFKDRLGRLPFIEKHVQMGRSAWIGRQAVDREQLSRNPEFVPSFKPMLLRDSFQTIARLNGKPVSAREAARLFLRELLAEITRVTGTRPRELVVGTPVDCYEPYRAELAKIGRSLGVKLRFIDEPVAAALGYGISATTNQAVLVIDFGAGTLDMAVVILNQEEVNHGSCRVLAKQGFAVGGQHVDSWLLEAFCKARAFDLRQMQEPEMVWWHRFMMDESRKVKERLFFEAHTHFLVDLPQNLHDFDALLGLNLREMTEPFGFSREDLVQLLSEKGLYDMLNEGLDHLLEHATARGVEAEHINEVLMVGGSTLLPGVYPLVEKRFGRERVRAWQPFHAVAYGGSVFGSGRMTRSDFITHDYAMMTYNAETHLPEHHIIIPKGSPYPSKDVWKRQMVPTCALGEPERIFKLIICEIGRKHQLEQEFLWDPSGRLHTLDSKNAGKSMIIPLNETNPSLGYMDPPHLPSVRTARLEISFGINEDRWLVATVLDLETRRFLMEEEAVVRLR